VLVGDAAHVMHPNIGQGANTGFESAAALVRSIIDHRRCFQDGSNWPVEAFHTYVAKRKPRADLVQRYANYVGIQQAAGKLDGGSSDSGSLISAKSRQAMLHWIRSGNRRDYRCDDADEDVGDDSVQQAPGDVVQAIEGFDPCKEPGVSRLW